MHPFTVDLVDIGRQAGRQAGSEVVFILVA
jgi:hypothetical protein